MNLSIPFRNLLERRRNHTFRRQLARTFATEAESPLDDRSIERMWNKISPNITAKPVRLRLNRKISPAYILIPVLAASLVGIFVIEKGQSPDGIKSAQSETLTLPVPILRFATLGADQEIKSGINAMDINAGSSLIFSVETENLPPEGALINIDYRTPAGKKEKLVENYLIHSGTNVIEGKKGFVAFTPEELGVYKFALSQQGKTKKGKAILFSGEANAGSFTVNVK